MSESVPARRAVGRLVVLGDSTSVGLGDPLPGGGWRGFGPLLAEALGGSDLTNLSRTGARIGTVRHEQLPMAAALRPDAVVIVAGMNDTMRSDFDPAQLRADLDHVVVKLLAVGAVVVLARYHDHARVFRLPKVLRRALRRRVDELNAVIHSVVADRGVGCVDLDALPGAYDLAAWSVDRLHPSELGHRMLAQGFAEELTQAGCAVESPVSLVCAGGRVVAPWQHVAWLVLKGIPWLWRRGYDLAPYAFAVLFRTAAGDSRQSSWATWTNYSQDNSVNS
ncbi:SGNH hydrolase [Kutzneria sp. CA-103260]|nr:SGNH hydrolase [Kutzneria sp. CA-103260]